MHAKTLENIKVRTICHMRDIASREMFYPNLWRFVWRRHVPNRMGTNAEAGNQQKHLLLSFVTKA